MSFTVSMTDLDKQIWISFCSGLTMGFCYRLTMGLRSVFTMGFCYRCSRDDGKLYSISKFSLFRVYLHLKVLPMSRTRGVLYPPAYTNRLVFSVFKYQSFNMSHLTLRGNRFFAPSLIVYQKMQSYVNRDMTFSYAISLLSYFSGLRAQRLTAA